VSDEARRVAAKHTAILAASAAQDASPNPTALLEAGMWKFFDGVRND